MFIQYILLYHFLLYVFIFIFQKLITSSCMIYSNVIDTFFLLASLFIDVFYYFFYTNRYNVTWKYSIYIFMTKCMILMVHATFCKKCSCEYFVYRRQIYLPKGTWKVFQSVRIPFEMYSMSFWKIFTIFSWNISFMRV